MYRSRLFTVVTFAGVLGFGTAALSQCSRGIQPGDLPTTTTTSTSTSSTTTTTLPRVVGDPFEEMVTVTPGGAAGSYADTDRSGWASITPDGRYVAFVSSAVDLVPDDTNGLGDVFVRDRVAGTTQRVNLKSDGSQVTTGDLAGTAYTYAAGILPMMSADGRYVAFSTSARLVASDTDAGTDVYRFDRVTGSLALVSVSPSGGGSGSSNPIASSISGDGRYVAFDSDSASLAPGDRDPAGSTTDVFVRDMVLGTTTLVSTPRPGGSPATCGAVMPLCAAGDRPDMTPDGRYIAFEANGVVSTSTREIVVYDQTTGTKELVSLDSWGQPARGAFAAISADGNVVVFANGDTTKLLTPDAPAGSNGTQIHLYARNRTAGTTVLVDANVPDLTTDREVLMDTASVSADGRYVAFDCFCQRVNTGPTPGLGHEGIYRADLSTGDVIEIDADANGVVANGESNGNDRAGITADGSSIVFSSQGDNLVGNDLNGHNDIFVSTPH